MRKLVESVAMSGSPILFLDNITGYFNSSSVNSLITSPTVTGRILGLSKTFTVRNRITVLTTGNNCRYGPDFRRRAIALELFMEEAKPEDRVIKDVLDANRILQLRPRVLSALWALVRDWNAKGRPSPKLQRAGFEAWSRIVCGIVEHAGLSSPCPEGLSASSGDRETADMEALVTALKPSTGYSFSELVEEAKAQNLLSWIIPAQDDLDPKQRSMLGKLFGRFTNRIFFRQYRFETTSTNPKTRQYRVVKIS